MLDMGFEPEVRSILSQTCTGWHIWSSFALFFAQLLTLSNDFYILSLFLQD